MFQGRRNLSFRGILEKAEVRLIDQNPVRVFWGYRSFIWRSALQDLRYRYAGSALGVLWHVLIPLAQILIYTAVFSQIMPMRMPGSGGVHGFAIYLCAGLLPWMGFSECVARGANCFLENANYLKKLSIPEQVFVARNAATATLGLLVSMSLLFVMIVLLGSRITWAWSVVAPVILLLQCVGFGLGLTLGCLNVFFRDIGQVLGTALQMWMWMTPIVYLKEILPRTLQVFLPFNPVFPFVEALQGIIVRGSWPEAWAWELMALWTFVIPLIGYLVLRKLRPEIRDVV
jgi:lipopolysaccharide transport system permease protein